MNNNQPTKVGERSGAFTLREVPPRTYPLQSIGMSWRTHCPPSLPLPIALAGRETKAAKPLGRPYEMPSEVEHGCDRLPPTTFCRVRLVCEENSQQPNSLEVH